MGIYSELVAKEIWKKKQGKLQRLGKYEISLATAYTSDFRYISSKFKSPYDVVHIRDLINKEFTNDNLQTYINWEVLSKEHEHEIRLTWKGKEFWYMLKELNNKHK